MPKKALDSASPWALFPRKFAEKIEKPRFAGLFSKEEAAAKGMRLVTGLAGGFKGLFVQFFLLVDEWDGVIADAKFKAFGPPALLGIAEILCELVMRKNYDQAKGIGAELIDKQLQDKKDARTLPITEYGFVNLSLDALEKALDLCADIPLPEAYVPTPVQPNLDGGLYEGWDQLSLKQQLAVLEDLIANEIRPYIELDAGGIEIVSLTEGRELMIAYKGACTTCPSSIGSTLNAIQQILSARIHPDIKVIPDKSFF